MKTMATSFAHHDCRLLSRILSECMMINLWFWRHLHPLVIADVNLYAGCNIQHQNIGRIKIYNTYW